MSNKQYVKKYSALVEKLMSYMVNNDEAIKKLPQNASYIAFSATNKDLNNFAQQILESTKKAHEDQPIVKAEEVKSTESWRFTTIAQ